MQNGAATVGRLFRSWRERRRVSQLDLATEARISQKHISFIESGRASPSRDMVLHLADSLDIPLRERNALLMAAGFAPIFRHRPLDDPALARARGSLERLLKAHEPFPALLVDRNWDVVSANAAVRPLLAGVDPELLKPPQNAMRLSLHPRGLAPLIVNLGEWREHLLERLRRELRIWHDDRTRALLAEVEAYPAKQATRNDHETLPAQDDVAIPLKLRTQHGVLSFISAVTTFGTAVDITLSEISMEAFYPADDDTSRVMSSLLGAPRIP